MKRRVILFLVIAGFLPAPLTAAGLPPWQFDMSKLQVAGFNDSGPC